MSDYSVDVSAYLDGNGPLFTPDMEDRVKQNFSEQLNFLTEDHKQSFQNIEQSCHNHNVIQNWIKEERELLFESRLKENKELYKSGALPANEINSNSELGNSVNRLMDRLNNDLGSVAPENMAAARFLLSTIRDIGDTLTKNKDYADIYGSIAKQLNQGKGKTSELNLSPEEITALSSEYAQKAEALQSTLSMQSQEQDVLLVASAVFDQLSGRKNTPSEFRGLPTRIQDTVRTFLQNRINNSEDPEIQQLSVDNILNLPENLNTKALESYNINFKTNPELDGDLIRRHGEESSAHLSRLGKDYMESCFNSAFDPLLSRFNISNDTMPGYNIFDYIKIGEQSATQLYENRYPDLSAEEKAKLMKCDIMIAVLNNKSKISFNPNLTSDGTLNPVKINGSGLLYDLQSEGFRDVLGRYVLNGTEKANQRFFPLYREDMLSSSAGVNTRINVSDKLASGEWTSEEAEFYNSLKTMAQNNQFTTEANRGNLGGLVCLAAATFLHDNPQAYFTDISSGKYKNEMTAAGNKVLSAIANAANKPEDMADIIANATKTYINIDYKKEVLHALGKDENMNTDMAEAEMKNPDNLPTVYAVLISLARYGIAADQVVKQAVSGRKNSAITYTEDDPSLDSEPAKTVYSMAREKLTAKERREYQEFTLNVSTKHTVMSTFTTWGSAMLREHMQNIYADSLATDVGISAIAKGGPLWATSTSDIKKLYDIQHAPISLSDAKELSENPKVRQQFGAIRQGFFSSKDKDKLLEQTAQYYQTPKMPEQLSGWVRFWNKFGFYEDKVAQYNKDMEEYNKRLLSIDREKQIKVPSQQMIDARRAALSSAVRNTEAQQQTPQVGQEAPQVEQTAPQVGQAAPQVEQTASQVGQEAPQVEQVAPQVEQEAPVRQVSLNNLTERKSKTTDDLQTRASQIKVPATKAHAKDDTQINQNKGSINM